MKLVMSLAQLPPSCLFNFQNIDKLSIFKISKNFFPWMVTVGPLKQDQRTRCGIRLIARQSLNYLSLSFEIDSKTKDMVKTDTKTKVLL